MKTARARATKKKHVILFLAANPSDTGRLALDREARSIHVELKRSGYRDRFDFVTRWAAEPLDLLRELRELKPTIVHFSGHGVSPDATTEPAPGGETEIAELIGRLRAGEREIFVIGPSGSGKSSLVTAGVLPRLARGVAGMGPFVVRELRPGDLSVARLSEALEAPAGKPLVVAERVAGLLAHRASGASLLIVVDQLEELFTLASAGERAQFLEVLRALRAERRCAVVFTLRADFFGTLMESDLWAERRGQLSRVEVSPLRGDALREAITAPARAVGVAVQPELIDRLVVDAAFEPGILPLLQETLVQLWDARVDQTLTLADYQTLSDGERSGLAVALARRADATLRRLMPGDATIVRRILLRLISFGEGRSDTRRQQSRSKLCSSAGEAAVLQQLIDERLLTADEDDGGGERVDLAHEIMITAWPTLADWIRNHRIDEQRRRQIEAAAAQWVMRGCGARGLLDPIELAEAESWQRTESALQLGHSAKVSELIAASRAAQVKQRRRRRRVVGGTFAMLAAVAVVVAVLAIAARESENDARRQANNAHVQEARARDEADTARHRLDELTLKHAQLLLTTDPSAAVDALASYRGTDRDRADQIRAEAVGRGVAFLRAQPHTDAIMWAAVDTNGTILSLSRDGTIARTQLDGKSVILTRDVSKIAMSSYSQVRQLLAYTCDPSDLCLFDFGRATRTPLGAVLQGASINGASFSPDGMVLAVISKDGTLRLLDVSDPTRPAIKLTSAVDATTDVAFVDDSVLSSAPRAGSSSFGRAEIRSSSRPPPTSHA